MNLKTFKTAQGDLAIYTADFRLNSRRSQKILYFIFGAALMLGIWFGVNDVHAETRYTKVQMVDYSMVVTNNALHNAK